MASGHDIVLENVKMKLKARCCPKNTHIHFESGVPDSDWSKVRSPQSDWPRNRHFRQRDQRGAKYWKQLKRYRGEEMEKIQIWIMIETRYENRRGGDTHMMKQGAVPTLHNEVRKKMRSTKDNLIEERCDAMDKGMKAGNSREVYDTLNDLTKPN